MRQVHLVGIGGMHMSAIAQLLLADGVRVTGSDQQDSEMTRRLTSMGATVYHGHAAAQVGDADLIVMTAAVRPDNPEISAARDRGIPVILRAEMVARLMQGRLGVAIAGTHGKTTTSSLVAWMLARAGRSPTYLLGGDAIDLGANAAAGAGPEIVVEADEYAGAFLEYRPQVAAITNVEWDHPDYYPTPDAIVAAFRGFLERVVPGGTVIACLDSPLLAELAQHPYPAAVQGYRVVGAGRHALPTDAEWVALDDGVTAVGGRTFAVMRNGAPFGRFESSRPGRYNVANATAAIATGAALGLSAEQMAGAVRSFRGARRRFERIGEASGVVVMDDYAHHPTEVRASLAAAREHFPGRRIVLLFQPHTYSRTLALREEFRDCFSGADVLYLLATYAARETADAGMDAAQLAKEIHHPQVRYVASHPHAVESLSGDVRPGDVVFTMGAGDVNRAGPALLAELAARSPNTLPPGE